MMWILLYALAGFVLGQQWPVVSQALSRYGGWLSGLAMVATVLYSNKPRTRTGEEPIGHTVVRC
jgi:membrane protein DedA with SNARE-associated domain